MTDMRQKIVEEALAVADEQGLEAVSMRAVAKRVGVSAMALYPHVSSKDALLDGVVDLLATELLQLLESTADETDWWARIVALAHGGRQLAAQHPSAFGLFLSRPSATPDAVRATDLIYQALLDAGIPDDQVPRAERIISTFVLGFATSEVSGRFSKGSLNPRARRAQLAPAEIPAHYRLADLLDEPTHWDSEFEADLENLRALIETLRKS